MPVSTRNRWPTRCSPRLAALVPAGAWAVARGRGASRHPYARGRGCPPSSKRRARDRGSGDRVRRAVRVGGPVVGREDAGQPPRLPRWPGRWCAGAGRSALSSALDRRPSRTAAAARPAAAAVLESGARDRGDRARQRAAGEPRRGAVGHRRPDAALQLALPDAGAAAGNQARVAQRPAAVAAVHGSRRVQGDQRHARASRRQPRAGRSRGGDPGERA